MLLCNFVIFVVNKKNSGQKKVVVKRKESWSRRRIVVKDTNEYNTLSMKHWLIYLIVLLMVSCAGPRRIDSTQHSRTQHEVRADTCIIYVWDSVLVHLPCDTALEQAYFGGRLAPVPLAEHYRSASAHSTVHDTLLLTDTVTVERTIEVPAPIPRTHCLVSRKLLYAMVGLIVVLVVVAIGKTLPIPPLKGGGIYPLKGGGI